jgi:hypothetical protein
MKTLKATLISLVLGTLFSIGVYAQGPPNPPAGQGTYGDQPPAGSTGAPIDSGSGILLLMAASYGLKKVYDLRIKRT